MEESVQIRVTVCMMETVWKGWEIVRVVLFEYKEATRCISRKFNAFLRDAGIVSCKWSRAETLGGHCRNSKWHVAMRRSMLIRIHRVWTQYCQKKTKKKTKKRIKLDRCLTLWCPKSPARVPSSCRFISSLYTLRGRLSLFPLQRMISLASSCLRHAMLPFVSRLCRISRCISAEIKIVKRNFAARASSNKGLQRVNYTGAWQELHFVDIRGRFDPAVSASIETLRGLLLRLPADSRISSHDAPCLLRDQSIIIGEILYIFVSRCLVFPAF